MKEIRDKDAREDYVRREGWDAEHSAGRREGWDVGRSEGRSEGEGRLNRLHGSLIADKRFEDLERSINEVKKPKSLPRSSYRADSLV